MTYRSLCPLLVGACLLAAPHLAHAQSAPVAASARPLAASSSPAPPAVSRQGAAVLAIGASTEHAWSLAQKTYASSTLRPASLDEAHARVLAGELPAEGAPSDVRDLADTRAAVRGDDAPSRQLLASIASMFALRAILVVDVAAPGPGGAASDGDGGAAAPVGSPRVRLFLADQSSFDAATFAPDAGAAGKFSWDRVVRSIERTLVPQSSVVPPLATKPLEEKAKEKTEESRPFYASAWFWGALGGAAFLGTAIYFASRDSSPGSIHLSMQVPR